MTDLFLGMLETSLLTGVVAVLLVALLPRLRRRYAAAGRCLIWLLLTLRFLFPVPLPRQAAAPVEITLPSTATVPLELTGGAAAAPSVPASPAPVSAPSPLALLGVLWLVVAAGVLLWQLTGYLRFRRELARWAVPVTDGPAAGLLAELSAQMGLRRTPRLLLDGKGHGPLLTGLFRPAVVLPDTDLSEEDLRFILTHELAHCKHGDLWFRLLLLLAGALHWFNPAVWLLRRAALADLELACDDTVLHTAGEDLRRDYCETILKAVQRGNARTTILTTSFQGGVRGMKQRFINIFQDKKKRGLWLVVPVAVAALLLGALVSCTVAPEPEEDSTPTDISTPAGQPNTGTHHPETHNPDHHTGEYHHDEEEHHAGEHDVTVSGVPTYVERDPDDGDFVEGLAGTGDLVYDGPKDPEDEAVEVHMDGALQESLAETAQNFAAAYFRNDLDSAAALLADGAPTELYGSDIWDQTELIAVKFDRDSFSANSFVSLQVECRLNGEDSCTYLGLELSPSADGWLVRDFWLEK